MKRPPVERRDKQPYKRHCSPRENDHITTKFTSKHSRVAKTSSKISMLGYFRGRKASSVKVDFAGLGILNEDCASSKF